ncbi:glycosyltransferase family 2 protein [Acidipila rosea]|uniref:GT2 family glycosyltransferase n=1 Tax=Acidipila rosea TaxID=768535 RepID=A0A4R1KXL5_9BACT|nr:glycosyltransferase family 2 protein [Acidipila rosea]MBW4026089.1 glycosyltransferase family 2 protein [Acidobacteriota bacterium]MBW4043992.1 glycosyltransferase family 2 protein [Acidobacteriota bacterium]TCK70152.1 GT2 family glycosyltransferase [Acidipila rosea]
MKNIAAVLTCFNRREKTLTALHALVVQSNLHSISISIFLTDDGSTDGTEDAVRAEFPEVHLIRGTGQLFWNGGMRAAMAEAARTDPDYYLWLNDDTHLDPDAISRLLAIVDQLQDQAIVVGATRDPISGDLTYGGVNRAGWTQPVSFRLVPESKAAVSCDTMNGNCVLIPREIYNRTGPMSSAYSHAMGDMDYGLRARRCGFEVVVAPGTVGTCARNPGQPKWRSTELTLSTRLKAMQQRKGLPLQEWRAFTSAHAGPFWFIYWLWPYLRTAIAPQSKPQ